MLLRGGVRNFVELPIVYRLKQCQNFTSIRFQNWTLFLINQIMYQFDGYLAISLGNWWQEI